MLCPVQSIPSPLHLSSGLVDMDVEKESIDHLLYKRGFTKLDKTWKLHGHTPRASTHAKWSKGQSTARGNPPSHDSNVIHLLLFMALSYASPPNASSSRLAPMNISQIRDTVKDSRRHISKTESRNSSRIEASDSSFKKLSNELLKKRIDVGLRLKTSTTTWLTPNLLTRDRKS